tara:strand:- start:371 stop:1225 length:855 start_codon:yes stop_codon:yes gene_type:complete
MGGCFFFLAYLCVHLDLFIDEVARKPEKILGDDVCNSIDAGDDVPTIFPCSLISTCVSTPDALIITSLFNATDMSSLLQTNLVGSKLFGSMSDGQVDVLTSILMDEDADTLSNAFINSDTQIPSRLVTDFLTNQIVPNIGVLTNSSDTVGLVGWITNATNEIESSSTTTFNDVFNTFENDTNIPDGFVNATFEDIFPFINSAQLFGDSDLTCGSGLVSKILSLRCSLIRDIFELRDLRFLSNSLVYSSIACFVFVIFAFGVVGTLNEILIVKRRVIVQRRMVNM